MKTIDKPKIGIEGLKAHFKSDVISGLLVFLLALPLSLGIAKASGFPAAMGVLTAMIGGISTAFFNVSILSIKGPAAGLITIAAASVLELGGGELGWQMACGVVVVMGLLQILLGFLKVGSLSDFFPHSAVHGMLAAIGIIIIAKQIPVLLGNDPVSYKGEGPVELLMNIPRFILNAHWHIATIGIIGIIIMFVFPRLKINFLNKVPAPMIVLIVAVPLTVIWNFSQTEPEYSLVKIGDFWGSLGMNANFSAIGTFVFWKYVIMFLFVSSLESLLTVKAIDGLDPYNRKSDYNGDLIGQGAGNVLTGLLGGLPMISEVVRSSANVGFGAKTKWSNFFHGVFLLLAMIFLIPFIELIPNSALSAMLIYAGYRLAEPKEFIHTYKIGKEQLAIFLVTIFITLAEDLLLGILAGILVKFIFHFIHGVRLNNLFKVKAIVTTNGTVTILKIEGSAIFSNLISFKKLLSAVDENNQIMIDFSETNLVDHSFMSFIHHFKSEKEAMNSSCQLVGFENHKSFSDHRLSTKKLIK